MVTTNYYFVKQGIKEATVESFIRTSFPVGDYSKTELQRRKRRKIFSITQMGYESKDYELSDEDSTPEKIVDGDMKGQAIRQEIEALPVKFREVVVLRDIQEFSYEEISGILKIPIGTVKSRVNRGRLRLQKRLKHLLDK